MVKSKEMVVNNKKENVTNKQMKSKLLHKKQKEI